MQDISQFVSKSLLWKSRIQHVTIAKYRKIEYTRNKHVNKGFWIRFLLDNCAWKLPLGAWWHIQPVPSLVRGSWCGLDYRTDLCWCYSCCWSTPFQLLGVIDGTLRPCCRPVRNQRILFSGHKRVHGIKFQVPQNKPFLLLHISWLWFFSSLSHMDLFVAYVLFPWKLLCKYSVNNLN